MTPRAGHVEATVFVLVAAAFTNIYITQPILPLIEREFAASTSVVAWTLSAVLLGIALANLPFGWLADRAPLRPIILSGASAIALAGIVASLTARIEVLIAARFIQGAFIPALTTCLAAHLARTLERTRLNVAMGGYVAATVLGGMLGRLLGGYVHSAQTWRHAFLSAALVVVVAAVAAARVLGSSAPPPVSAQRDAISFRALLTRSELWRAYVCGLVGQAVFSPVFTYMPYRLAEARFGLSTADTTLVYLVYLVGIVMGPGAGALANRWGSGRTMVAATGVFALALALLTLPAVSAVVVALVLVCAGFFTLHAAAVALLNRKLALGQGRANAFYVLGYYCGAGLGVTWASYAYQSGGWQLVIGFAMLLLSVPLFAGLREWHDERLPKSPTAWR
jgi:YNFM family putative membrane transporter